MHSEPIFTDVFYAFPHRRFHFILEVHLFIMSVPVPGRERAIRARLMRGLISIRRRSLSRIHHRLANAARPRSGIIISLGLWLCLLFQSALLINIEARALPDPA